MSACISISGEYSDHELTRADEPFTCQRCFVFDEAAAVEEVRRLRASAAPVDRFAHFVPDGHAREKALEKGAPVVAVCGKVWVPSREPFAFPLCPTCAIDALRYGWMA